MLGDCFNLVGDITYDKNRVDITITNPTTEYFTKKTTEETSTT